MECDIDEISDELERAVLHSPIPLDVAIAIVSDCFRMAECAPVPDEDWERWEEEAGPLWREQMGMLAHLLATTSLREITVSALAESGEDRRGELSRFFERIEPLTAEMIRSNAFRREECIRRWLQWCGAEIAGESPEESTRRLQRLDYRKTLAEYERAEMARKQEMKSRMEKARRQKSAARGWRE